jgi:hypothetical protein
MSGGNGRISRPPIARPFHEEDVRRGAEALRLRLKLGSPLDLIATTREILDASGVISARAAPNVAKGRKESTDAQVTP